MDNLHIGICDDDVQVSLLIEKQIRSILQNYSNQVEVTIMTFNAGDDFIKGCKEIAFDLILLDIEMPKKNGFQLAMEIRPFCLDTYLVFVSGHESYVYNSFEFNAKGFIRKSCLEMDIQRTIEKYMEDTTKKRITYRVNDGFGKEEVLVKDICYIECNGHDVMIKTIEKEYHIYSSLKRMEEELSEYDFLKVHRNYLVNKRYIKNVGSRNIELKDGSLVDLSRDRKKEVVEEMKKYDRKMERAF